MLPPETLRVFVGSSELATEVHRVFAKMGETVSVELDSNPWAAVAPLWRSGVPAVGASFLKPSLRDLVISGSLGFPVCPLAWAPESLHGIMGDLGIVCPKTLEGLAVASLLPWSESELKLGVNAPDSEYARRFFSQISPSEKSVEVTARDNGYVATLGGRSVALSSLADLFDAVTAINAALKLNHRERAIVEGINLDSVETILFGPKRILSDPASKQVLKAYGVPIPLEELCGSASRAASEGTRFGYPIRMTLASPDLRVWDHPELSVEFVRSAADVKDAFRSLTILAAEKNPTARVLGASISVQIPARVSLSLEVRPVARGTLEMTLGYADEVGRHLPPVHTVIPTSSDRLERALSRLAASSSLFESPAERPRLIANLVDLCTRIAAMFEHFEGHLDYLRIDPLAILITGQLEAREVALGVTNRFEEQLAAPSTRRMVG